MKTLTIPEATTDLAAVLAQVIAGEEIGIRSGGTIVALRPLTSSDIPTPEAEPTTPPDALRCLQKEARLTPAQAQSYLNEARAERSAAGE